MKVYRRSSCLLQLLVKLEIFFIALQGVHGEVDGPSESECRPYIEKALKQLETGDTLLPTQNDEYDDGREEIPTIEITTDDSDEATGYEENEDDDKQDSNESTEIIKEEATNSESIENDENKNDDDDNETDDDESGEQITSAENGGREVTTENIIEQDPIVLQEAEVLQETSTEPEQSSERFAENLIIFTDEDTGLPKQDSSEIGGNNEANDEDSSSKESDIKLNEEAIYILKAVPNTVSVDLSKEVESINGPDDEHIERQNSDSTESEEKLEANEDELQTGNNISASDSKESLPDFIHESKEQDGPATTRTDNEDDKNDSGQIYNNKEVVTTPKEELNNKEVPQSKEGDNSNEAQSNENEDYTLVEELIEASEENLVELRPREHINQLLKLDEDSSASSKSIERTSEIILRDLKKVYDNAIKPLETLYKYKDLSNRHFGDSEIYAKPLILLMGPWSGGKSSIINYLLGIEHGDHALHTGAEPSPAYFNILMYGEEHEILDGTQLAADYTFSGLQKFGQGLEERLRGYRLPSKLLEKVNIVEIPGILEVRKQVSRVFPFNDACQWFIDRADIIFLVYDPSKLDVGPETEAILDQLKGREHQTRIVLNKADQVKPEELMRVQGALIWNISPLMSSAQPPTMYTTSLWSKPYESWAPIRLLQAQERAFLRDIRSTVDKRIDNKIASARRFAVRVRNHAKMVDCYLTTYYNHKSVFGNRKQISDEIINHPQDFHIYEGLSTLTNISRYDLPDPDVYRDFFRLNALYDFQQLSATCTYFRGCPINRLDIAIAYDLPELVGKHKKLLETTASDVTKTSTPQS